jgi:hypothetical protein
MQPIKITYNTDNIGIIPVEGLIKYVASNVGNNIVFTYLSGATITVGITLADAAAELALEGRFTNLVTLSLNAGTDAKGLIEYPYSNTFTTFA